MKLTRIPVVAFALVALLGIAAVTGGCSDGQESPPEVVPGTPPIIDQPAIYPMSGDRVRAVGVLDWVDLEGGFWAVVGVADAEGVQSTVVAVIANPDSLDADLDSLRGRYVQVTGTQLDGASIRMAGPEINAERIEVIGEESE